MKISARRIIFFLASVGIAVGVEYKVTDIVTLDVNIRGLPAGQIVIGLFGDIVPKTVKNFITFATRGFRGRKYEGSPFHRVIKNFMIQGGDVLFGNGAGVISIYGKTFPDENFIVKHSAAGFVSMANGGPDQNGCQFLLSHNQRPGWTESTSCLGSLKAWIKATYIPLGMSFAILCLFHWFYKKLDIV